MSAIWKAQGKQTLSQRQISSLVFSASAMGKLHQYSSGPAVRRSGETGHRAGRERATMGERGRDNEQQRRIGGETGRRVRMRPSKRG